MKTKAPSWREVANFVNFLNRQFQCYELSDFTKEVASEQLGSFSIRLIPNFANILAPENIGNLNINPGNTLLLTTM